MEKKKMVLMVDIYRVQEVEIDNGHMAKGTRFIYVPMREGGPKERIVAE